MISGPLLPGADLLDVVHEAVLGGADVIQLRDKRGSDRDQLEQLKRLLPVTRALGVPLIVNDRPDIAQKAGADGVHLGQEDGSLADAIAVLGPDAIYGRSTHSYEQALTAEREGFDYIGVGPVFVTPTKAGRPAIGLETVQVVSRALEIPFVAIGGIDDSNVEDVLGAGARAVAVVRAVMGARDPRAAAAQIRRSVDKTALLRSL